jgi:flagellar hook protein FlgE
MLRSLSSSVTGLKNHQTSMDVIGNNIANVNTTGFKSGRITFEESFSQLLEGSSRPPGGGGGTNPLQIGLGMSLGSIDSIMNQGNLQATGQILDMAIEGNAYFAVSDGEGQYYTRAGAFQMDSQGKVVLPNNGMILQGKMANLDGVFAPGTAITDITLPFSEQAPANATEEINFSRNLDAEAGAKGSILYTQKFLAHATDGTAYSYIDPDDGVTPVILPGTQDDLLVGLHDAKGRDLNIAAGDIISVNIITADGTEYLRNIQIDDHTATIPDPSKITSLSQLLAQIGQAVTTATGVAPAQLQMENGRMVFEPGAGIPAANQIATLQLNSDNPLSNSLLNRAFNVDSNPRNGSEYFSGSLFSPGAGTDVMATLFDANGNGLGLETGDNMVMTASLGGEENISNNALIAGGVQMNTTTLNDLLTNIRDTLKLPYYDGTPRNNLTVSVNATGTDDELPDGSLIIRGAKGADFGIENFTLMAENTNGNQTIPSLFNANLSTTEYQQAQDNGIFDTSISIYDESGVEHVMTMTFVHTDSANVWDWSATVVGDAEVIQGSNGTLTFGQDGTVASFSYEDNSTDMVIEPNNGSRIMRVNLDVGGPGQFQGITQFAAPSTVSAIGQDGFPTGNLTKISVDEYGIIRGNFSNGVNKTIAQLHVAEFINPGGLQRVADSILTVSANSGDPVLGAPGTQSSSKIRPGALEMSNVDLANEFTAMITTQRGFQSNSRVITVSDSMLDELLALKR